MGCFTATLGCCNQLLDDLKLNKVRSWVIIMRLAYEASSATEELQEIIYKSIAERLKRYRSE